MSTAAAAPRAELAALEHQVVDDEGRQLGGDARTAAGQRADEVEGLDGELQQDRRRR